MAASNSFTQALMKFNDLDSDNSIGDDDDIRLLDLEEADLSFTHSGLIDKFSMETKDLEQLGNKVLYISIDFSVSGELCELMSISPHKIVRFASCPKAKDVQILTYIPNLTYLIYGRSMLPSFFFDLLPVLPQLSHLKHLEIDMNSSTFYRSVNYNFLQQLGKAIVQHSKLESLYIGYTTVTEKGLSQFLETISKMSTWKRIVLDVDLEDGHIEEYLKKWKSSSNALPVSYLDN